MSDLAKFLCRLGALLILGATSLGAAPAPAEERHAIERIASAIRARRDSIATLRISAKVEEARFSEGSAQIYRRDLELLKSGESVRSRFAGDVRVVGGRSEWSRFGEKQASFHDGTFTFYAPDAGETPAAILDKEGLVVNDVSLECRNSLKMSPC